MYEQNAKSPAFSGSLLDIIQNEPLSLPYGSPNLPDKNHFKPFSVLKTQTVSPNENNFGFSNSLHCFFMHFCI